MGFGLAKFVSAFCVNASLESGKGIYLWPHWENIYIVIQVLGHGAAERLLERKKVLLIRRESDIINTPFRGNTEAQQFISKGLERVCRREIKSLHTDVPS